MLSSIFTAGIISSYLLLKRSGPRRRAIPIAKDAPSLSPLYRWLKDNAIASGALQPEAQKIPLKLEAPANKKM